jgi:uncharacterized protein (TIGR00299 family) protein
VKLAYFDCPSGASGDMVLGALIDAGVPLHALRDELAKLHVPGWELSAREVRRGAFRATKVDVHVEQAEHHHRGLRDIVEILDGSDLAVPVKQGAARIFTRLAEAEARVHGTTPDEVHFHEVGAIDAIVDVTGAVLGLHLMGVAAVHVSALPVGSGTIKGAHGPMPVPAPGTAELLKGFPVIDSGVRAELVTPTGAAILTTLAISAGRMPAMTVEAIGYGAGTKDLEIPNILRCFIGEAAAAFATETMTQIETTIDDMSPQLYEPLMERLFEAGAVDVFLTPVAMKKSRPGIVLTALCPTPRVAELARVLFEESTTIGVRWWEVSRAVLPREIQMLATPHGPIPFKVSRLGGRIVTVTPEFDHVARIARECQRSVREVLDEARAAGRRLLAQGPDSTAS